MSGLWKGCGGSIRSSGVTVNDVRHVVLKMHDSGPLSLNPAEQEGA